MRTKAIKTGPRWGHRILVTAKHVHDYAAEIPGMTGTLAPVNTVRVEREFETVENRVIRCREEWSDTTLNRLGQLGAIAFLPDIAAIEAAVTEFRQRYPDLPVQDNAGVLPHG